MGKGHLVGLVAETPIHVGIGAAADALDLPVAREAITEFPHVPGSGVKGALRVWAQEADRGLDVDRLFGSGAGGVDDGTDGKAGAILCGEAKLALLPVRCTSDAYKLAICPMIINRLVRDLARLGVKASHIAPDIARVAEGSYLGQALPNSALLGLEEREVQHAGDVPPSLIKFILPLAPDAFDESTLNKRVIVLSDADFKWFAKFGLPVATRNALDPNKSVTNSALWSEETLAPDTVMWMLLSERISGSLSSMEEAIRANKYIQMGGNETIGQGWFGMQIYQSFGEN